jgi:alkaline phosphatase
MFRSLLAIGLGSAVASFAIAADTRPSPRSVVFLHIDGMSSSTWMGVRLREVGPDGRLAFDRLPQTALYVGPMRDSVSASSNGGATSHAYGVRADSDSYASLDGKPIAKSRSGFAGSVMLEARERGKAIGIVNSSSLTEPGTGAFLAAVADRDDENEIAAQILAARPDVALGGGEGFFLPEGVEGRHGPGLRRDGRNLIEEARAAGYAIVFDATELAALKPGTRPVLGLFAHEETFNEGTEQQLAASRKPIFQPQAPRIDTMIEAALMLLSRDSDGFLLVANEEASDNFAGENHARAVLDAGAGADRAIARALEFARQYPLTTILVASDSECGGFALTGDDVIAARPVAAKGENGAPQDGDLNGLPFLAAADSRGRRLPFVVNWASAGDGSGGVIARGSGPGAALIQGTIDSTDIYRALYLGVFERRID